MEIEDNERRDDTQNEQTRISAGGWLKREKESVCQTMDCIHRKRKKKSP